MPLRLTLGLVAIILASAVIGSSQLGWRAGTPEPVLDGDPGFVKLYWNAWENVHGTVVTNDSPGRLPHRFAAPHGRMSFDETLHLAFWTRWGWRAFPIRETLEFMLNEVQSSGRIYGMIPAEPAAVGAGEATGPPLTGLALWSLYSMEGDGDLLRMGLAPAARRHTFLLGTYSVAPRETEKVGRFVVPVEYSLVPWGGRGEVRTSAEAVALILQDASYLAKCSGALGLRDSERVFRERAQENARLLESLWDADAAAFIGRTDDDGPAERVSLAPFWGLLGGQVSDAMAIQAARALSDPARFARRVHYPMLPRTDPGSDAASGGRPLFQYLTVRALMDAGQRNLAARSAEHILRVYELAGGEKGTLFGEYGVDTRRPAPGAEENAVEAGLVAVGALIEAVIGIEANAKDNELTWHVRRTDRHGLRNLRFGDNKVSLVARERSLPNTAVEIEVEAERPFRLRVVIGAAERTIHVRAGTSVARAG